MSKSIDVSASADVNPYVFAAGWTNLFDTWKIVSFHLKPTFSGSGVSMFVVAAPPATGTLDVTFTVNHDNNVYSDTSGAAFVNAAGTGYIFELNGDAAVVREVTAGVISGANLGFVTGRVYASGAEFSAIFTIAGAASTLDVYQGVTLLFQVTSLAHSAGMAGGGFARWDNNGSAGLISITANEGASTAIDTIDTPLAVGGTGKAITTTGLGTLTTLTFGSGKSCLSISAPSGDGTFAMPAFAHGVTYPAMGTQTFIAGDGTLTASTTSSVATMAGYTAVTMVDPLDTGEWSIASDPAIVDDDVIHLPTAAGTLNSDGSLTDYVFGVYTMWRWEAATGTMYTSQLTVSQSGVSIDNGITTSGISDASISQRSITGRI